MGTAPCAAPAPAAPPPCAAGCCGAARAPVISSERSSAHRQQRAATLNPPAWQPRPRTHSKACRVSASLSAACALRRCSTPCLTHVHICTTGAGNPEPPGSSPGVLPLRRLDKLADALELLLLARRPQLGVVPLNPAAVLPRLGLRWTCVIGGGCWVGEGTGCLGGAALGAGGGSARVCSTGAARARPAAVLQPCCPGGRSRTWAVLRAQRAQRSPAQYPPHPGGGTRASS